jgi:hypothetical protein
MRVIYFAIIMASLLMGCSRRDPIDRLMAEIPKEFVASYPFQPIQLPDTATPEQLVSALSKRGPEKLGHFEFKSYKILEIRQTHTTPDLPDGMPVDKFTAVLLDTDLGQKIVVFQPQTLKGIWHGWYYKTYDAK